MSTYSLAEVAKHNTANDLWIVLEGKVYDVTAYADEHPGGDETIVDHAGQDATTDFDDIGHSSEAKELLKKYYVGDVGESSSPSAPANSPSPIQVSVTHTPKASGGSLNILIPVGIILVALLFKFYA